MTTTVNPELRSSSPSRMRRNAVAALAGAAIIASSSFAVSRIIDNDSPRAGTQSSNESTIGVTQMNGAFHVFTPAVNESTIGVTEMNGAFHVFTPPAPATPLQGVEDAVAGLTMTNPAPATPLQGIEAAVAGLVAR